jgi:hypothetical protein
MDVHRLILPRLLLACVTCVTAGCAVRGLRPDTATPAASCAATDVGTSSPTDTAGSWTICGHSRRFAPHPESAATALYRRGKRAEKKGEVSAVDDFYQAAMMAWAEMFGPRPDGTRPVHLSDDGLVRLYNDAAGRCVEAAWRFDRFDPCRGLTVRTAAGERLIPLCHNLPWSPGRMHELRYVDARACLKLDAAHGRAGLGAPMVATQHRDECDPRDHFLLDVHPYACTVILRPPTDPAGERLEFHDPIRHTHVEAACLTVPLRAEPSAAIESAWRLQSFNHNPWRNFFLPHVMRPQHRMYLLEPYQPGRIPLVLVHGFLSDPWSWSRMVNSLRSDPELMRRYQIALFFYPTSVDITLPAADLREELCELVAHHDPHGEDPAMRQMVLGGFSLGGLLSKLQVTYSGDRLWRAYSKVPFDQVELDAESRAFFARLFFFEPMPFVKRVVFLATPHDGVTVPARAARGIGRLLAGNLPEAEEHYWEFRLKNPNAARKFLPRTFPSSVFDLTEERQILPAMKDLPFDPCVKRHTIYGEMPCYLVGEPSDLVVTVDSARTAGVESELKVHTYHHNVSRDEVSTAEMKEILWQHWREAAATAPPIMPTVPALDALPDLLPDPLPVETEDAPVPAPAPLQ